MPMHHAVIGLALLLLGCSDSPRTPVEPPPGTSIRPIVLRTTWNRDSGQPDSVVAEGDSIIVRRSFRQDSCCFADLLPTVTVDDSTIHLELQSPRAPTSAFPYTLKLETIIRRGTTGAVRLVQDVRYPGIHAFSDSALLPAIPAANTLPPLSVTGSFVLGQYAPTPDTLTSVGVAAGVVRLAGSVVTGGWTPYLQTGLQPEQTDSLLTLHIADFGFPFPSVSRIVFSTAVAGLPPGPHRLRVEYRGRFLDTTVTMPP